MHTCGRAELDEVIGGTHHGFIMLDDEDAVSEISQAMQRADEALVVRRMQADARLIEHIKHAGESRADLRGQSNALRLPTRKACRSVDSDQIAQTDLLQEFEPFQNLPLQLADIGLLLRRDIEFTHPVQSAGNVQRGELMDVQSRARLSTGH
jgi:hypothetical protein